MFALGIAIISTSSSYSVDLTHILFGNVLGVSGADIRILAICGVAVAGLVFVLYQDLLVISFDPVLAKTLKLPVEALRLLLLILIAVTIIASLQTVGVALMLAMLVTPAATARLLVKRLHHMIFVASFLGAVSGAVGLYISYHGDISSGPAIVLTATAIFIVVYATSLLRPAHQ
jgi:ABC-type Mn2+/Zn2+ transport system permease subunit